MNYLKVYVDLIESRRNTIYNAYVEKHHIIPKSISNTKFIKELLPQYSKDDIIILSGREHYIAHALLVKICKNNKNCYIKMLYAWNIMRSKGNFAKLFNLYKTRFSIFSREKALGKPSGAKGKKWSEEAKQTRKDTHYMKGKTYEEIYGEEIAAEMKELKRKQLTGRVFSDITISLMKESAKNRTQEWRDKISVARKGSQMSDDAKKKISEFMSNPDTNPSVDQTLYTFINVNTGEIVIARKYDMKRNYGCLSIHRVIRNPGAVCKGWKLLTDGDIKNA